MAGERLRISHVGVRGVVGEGLTAAHVLDFAAAFATFLGDPGEVVVARDPRASGVMIREGVVSSLLACGHSVVDLGIAPTPVLQHEIRRRSAAGGVSIGASHNRVEWNALKFFGHNATYLSTGEAGELLDIYHLKKFAFVEWDRIGKLTAETGAVEAYLDTLAEVFDFDRLRGYRVLVDCTNGTSSIILRRMNARFGTEFILINERMEGRQFAHDPATTGKVVELQLAPLVPHVRADAGFLFDIDSDRVAFATETGDAVNEEMVLVLLADAALEEGPGNLVITNVSTTALLEEVAARHGGKVIRVPVGRQAAIDALANYKPEQVAVAGEGTGAVMLPRFRFVYDGIASMLRILTIMERRGISLSELVGGFSKYSILKGKIALESHRLPEMLNEIETRFPDGAAMRLDGLRIDWPGRWVHVRVSQTEPLVRVICEQRGDPPRELFDHVMDVVRSYTA
jgi:phosphomannomutase